VAANEDGISWVLRLAGTPGEDVTVLITGRGAATSAQAKD
jgi:hypothetical protein